MSQKAGEPWRAMGTHLEPLELGLQLWDVREEVALDDSLERLRPLLLLEHERLPETAARGPRQRRSHEALARAADLVLSCGCVAGHAAGASRQRSARVGPLAGVGAA